MTSTLEQYNKALANCQTLFEEKTKDYGTAWRILRTSSLTDQLYIKALRIRSIEEFGSQVIDDSVESEYMGLVNYSIMALIQIDMPLEEGINLPTEKVFSLYTAKALKATRLMQAKNRDYGEAWRKMRLSSMTDLILMKLLRIKQIEDNMGQTRISEGIDANYLDIINWALFALIKISESK